MNKRLLKNQNGAGQSEILESDLFAASIHPEEYINNVRSTPAEDVLCKEDFLPLQYMHQTQLY